jgi:hypothetical protein
MTAAPASAIILRVIELLLLLRREERANLRHRIVHYRLGFFHRFPADIFNLRRRLIDDWLDLRLLVRREIQLRGRALERIAMTAGAAAPLLILSTSTRRLGKGETAERKSAEGYKCDNFYFHTLCLMTRRNRRRLQFFSK